MYEALLVGCLCRGALQTQTAVSALRAAVAVWVLHFEGPPEAVAPWACPR